MKISKYMYVSLNSTGHQSINQGFALLFNQNTLLKSTRSDPLKAKKPRGSIPHGFLYFNSKNRIMAYCCFICSFKRSPNVVATLLSFTYSAMSAVLTSSTAFTERTIERLRRSTLTKRASTSSPTL